MPEFPTYQAPWLQPDRNDPSHWILPAMEAGAAMAERRREFGLKMQEFGLRQRQNEMLMVGESLKNELMHKEIDDGHELQKGMVALQTGQDYQPQLTTARAIQTWETLKVQHARLKGLTLAQTADGQAELEMNKRYADILATDKTGQAYSELKGLEYEHGKNSREWRQSFARFGAQMDTEKAEAALKLRTASAEVAGQYRLKTAEENNAAKAEMFLNAEGAPVGQLQKITQPDGTVTIDPGHFQKWTGHSWQTYAVTKDNLRDLTIPEQERAIGGIISANKTLLESGVPAALQKEYRANIVKFTGMLDDLLKRKPAAATKPPVGAKPNKEAAALEAEGLIGQYPDKEDAIRARYKATYGEDL